MLTYDTPATSQGRIQDFKLGGGAHLKKSRRAEGDAKNLGYFVWKITILRQKIIFFSNFRGGARRVRPLWIRPWILHTIAVQHKGDVV